MSPPSWILNIPFEWALSLALKQIGPVEPVLTFFQLTDNKKKNQFQLEIALLEHEARVERS